MTAILDLFSLAIIIFYVYVEHNQHMKTEHDLTSAVGDGGLDYQVTKNNFMGLSSHTWRTVVGLAIIGIIGALQALHGQVGWSAWIDMILPILLVAEHAFAGKME